MARKGVLRIKIAGDASNFSKTMQGAIGKLGGFAKAAAKAGAVAAGAFAAVSVKAFADFDQAMTESVAIMGDVSDEMRKGMSDAAREVAKTTKFSAAEAAESYFFLASAGLDAAESIEALPKVAAFAQAGAFDMATATDLLTDAQSALGLAVDDATQNLENMARTGDVLVKANTLANASVEQFSEALTEKAGAALRTLNKEVEEGVAVLGVFADQGVKGSAAGTALNSVLEGLTRTARENADAYNELGVEVFDAEGEMRNMADIVADLESALGDMSTEGRDAAIAQLGLTRTARDGILALLGSSDAIREYEGALQDAGGTVDEIAENQLESFSAQIGLIRDRLMDVAITVGGQIAPRILTAFDTMSEAWDFFTAELSGNKAEARVARMTGRMTFVGEVAVWLADTYKTVRDRIVTAVEAVKVWWDENGPAIVARVREVAEAVVTWWEETGRDAIETFGQAVSDFWFETAKPALEALQTAWNNSEEDLTRIWENLQDTIEHLGNIFGDVMAATKTTAENDSSDMVSSFESIIDAIDLVVWAVEGIVSVFETVSDWEDTAFGGMVFEAFTQMTNLSRAFRNALQDYRDLKRALGFGAGKSQGPTFSKGGGSGFDAGIPRLHSGGLFEANSPRLSVVGDNRTQREIVSPEGLMRKVVRQESGGGDVHIHMPAGSDGDDVVRALERHRRRNGGFPWDN